MGLDIRLKVCYYEYRKSTMSDAMKRRDVKITVLSYYSLNDVPECVVCGCLDITKLEIDHIEDGGNAHRKQLNNHGGYAFIVGYRK